MKSRINFTEEFELTLRLDCGAQHVIGCEVTHLLARSPRHILFVFTLYWTSLLWSILTAVQKGHLLTSVTWLYHGLRYTTHWWGDTFFKVVCWPVFGFHLITGSGPFFQRWNRPFYSYGWKQGWSWPCFDTSLLALLRKSIFSYAN